MSRPNPEIKVVGFGENPTERFASALVALGYRPRLSLGEGWLARDGNPIPATALLLGEGTYSKEPIISRLQGCIDPAVLGVFCGDSEVNDNVLTTLCRDFLIWPCSQPELKVRLARIHGEKVATAGRTQENARLLAVSNMVGESEVFARVLRRLRKFAQSKAPALIHGETGTGKEMAARAIHYLSDRRDGPFIPVNCGAIPDALIENELFGHRRGAFTGARESQPGQIEQAEGGTLFLDEVGNLSLRGQGVLLRFLQNQEFKRLGGRRLRQADVRIVAATNAEIGALTRAQCFREDLLYRLHILDVELPPLRERIGDAVLLAEHFLDRFRRQYQRGPIRFSRRSLEWIDRYSWPGNVRELENLVHRGFLLAEGTAINVVDPGHDDSESPELPSECRSPIGSFQDAKTRMILEFERDYLIGLMRRARGNVSKAARLAGKERRALGKLLRKHAIDRERFATGA